MGSGASKVSPTRGVSSTDLDQKVRRAAAAMWEVSVALHPALAAIQEGPWRYAALACSTREQEAAVLYGYLAHCAARARAGGPPGPAYTLRDG